jgi:hypothetical protein
MCVFYTEEGNTNVHKGGCTLTSVAEGLDIFLPLDCRVVAVGHKGLDSVLKTGCSHI